MQALIDKILHGIIHKPMLGDAAFACKSRAGNADAKVRAKTFGIGSGMACVVSTFVDDLQICGVQALGEP